MDRDSTSQQARLGADRRKPPNQSTRSRQKARVFSFDPNNRSPITHGFYDSVSKLRKRSGVFSNSSAVPMPRANGWGHNHHQPQMQTVDCSECVGQGLAQNDSAD